MNSTRRSSPCSRMRSSLGVTSCSSSFLRFSCAREIPATGTNNPPATAADYHRKVRRNCSDTCSSNPGELINSILYYRCTYPPGDQQNEWVAEKMSELVVTANGLGTKLNNFNALR